MKSRMHKNMTSEQMFHCSEVKVKKRQKHFSYKDVKVEAKA